MCDNGSSTSNGTSAFTGSGVNTQGNQWCRYQGSDGGNAYHYHNQNGSYYQKDADGSTYYDTGRGYSQKTSPSGQTTKSYGKN
ncbi:hypothetical protein FA13DRAFT_1730682 [Coprinellus micaceus]|uniref:Uncharacterized protein n=1 Tax=Coprinellus micaceus TaxID=71717 RepID=A0A4Y7THH6_COPMI|nr:hypothetical protein FA13DRAFT_1730682 [Coprinellus micaceus]